MSNYKEFNKIEHKELSDYLNEINNASKEGWTVDKTETVIMDFNTTPRAFQPTYLPKTVHIAHLSRDAKKLTSTPNATETPTQDQLAALVFHIRELDFSNKLRTAGLNTSIERTSLDTNTLKVWDSKGNHFEVSLKGVTNGFKGDGGEYQLSDNATYADACKLVGYEPQR